MTATLIDGKARAARLREAVSGAVAALKATEALTPGLAVVLVGEDPASKVYVANKARQTEECGMRSFEHRLPEETSEADLLALVERLNADPDVDGILVQMPLPGHIDTDKVVLAIDPAKDVDGLHPQNAGRIVLGKPGLVPCTPQGCVILAKEAMGGDLSGVNAVVLGRSILVGKPVALLLQNENCTVTMVHSRSRDIAALCRSADLLVAAVGRPQMVRGDWVKPGATVIDVGINRVPAPEKGEGKTRLVGDVAFDEAVEVAGAITPVPGGVGPMTIACLLANTVVAACQRRGLAVPAM
ncbi:bifunctional methylenetetrahydrofolate dehydrogenase/methenyltetrahydrofolate cyclohydrolase FolD [Stappia indica]|uniref:bifunctional methylenetetrahydrofolate dehydrogenase/methenyltetrahydrofolate cyclohydrolase FolD n=1 Tax=Stappia indica TaxID=538381 RepID=UPI001CD5843A|nr:bifunctional methylenetetrahydrofolate dehydrogenase/methenyltetrahydrofolate cyclohydrolase FolD [Stappia indica]MCA1300161.1 bifunctional methylenetetrahydrofolate dehydrogenase/methenyltetrahydrofolate cyclohydrolase FolD [Stappia indica]